MRLGREEYRVVQPARPLPHAPLYEGHLGVEASVDKASARAIAVAWEFAMRSLHVVYCDEHRIHA